MKPSELKSLIRTVIQEENYMMENDLRMIKKSLGILLKEYKGPNKIIESKVQQITNKVLGRTTPKVIQPIVQSDPLMSILEQTKQEMITNHDDFAQVNNLTEAIEGDTFIQPAADPIGVVKDYSEIMKAMKLT